MKHYSEADLLETYYMQPGQSMPVMMHLAECTDAAAALAFLLGGAVVFETVKPSASHTNTTTVAVPTATNKTPAVEPAPKTPPEDLLLHDAWQSDELRQFHGVVQWESWTPEATHAKGDAPL